MSDTISSVLPRLLPIRLPVRMQEMVGNALGAREIEKTYQAVRDTDCGFSIATRLIRQLEVAVRVSDQDLDRIPRSGPVLLAVNHPFGILDAAVIASLLSRLRPDIKFLANGILAAIPEIQDFLIPVDVLSGKRTGGTNRIAIRKAIEFLSAGGLLVVFPSGVVSHFQWKQRSVADPQWSTGIAKLLAVTSQQAPSIFVVPAYVEGRNSLLFQAAGLVHPGLRTALLGRELLNKRGACVHVRFGSPIPAEKLRAIPTARERTEYVRWRTYLLAARRDYKPRMSLPMLHRERAKTVAEPIGQAQDAATMIREVAALSPLAVSSGHAVYLARATEIPTVLQEIGRLREIAFRAAGEGTGRAIDLDRFDSHYLHLFVWNHGQQEIAGAYRLTGTDWTRRQLGLSGLYTATLFKYGDEFLDRMGTALELGRSFVRVEYQRTITPLLLLWKGIGSYVARHPRYKVLFGPVSISSQYQSVSRQLMVWFLERHAGMRDWTGLVSSRNGYRVPRRQTPPLPDVQFDLDELSAAVSDVEPSRTGVPVLLRQYLKLGGRLLGFNVDPEFSNALDGLILVDLTKTAPALLERYMGRSEVARFLAFQKGDHETQ